MGSRRTTVMFNLRRHPITVNRAAVGALSDPFQGADSTLAAHPVHVARASAAGLALPALCLFRPHSTFVAWITSVAEQQRRTFVDALTPRTPGGPLIAIVAPAAQLVNTLLDFSRIDAGRAPSRRADIQYARATPAHAVERRPTRLVVPRLGLGGCPIMMRKCFVLVRARSSARRQEQWTWDG